MTKLSKVVIFLTCTLLSIAGHAETNPSDNNQGEDVDAKVKFEGGTVIVDLSMTVDASPQLAWAVLTDFDHMASFVSNLKESHLISTVGNILTIFQRGEANFGMISFPFESTRELELTPFNKIQSHLISGSMRKMEGLTQISVEGNITKIITHTESIPGNWIPPVVGRSFIEHESREQYQEIRKEIIKRKRLTPATTN